MATGNELRLLKIDWIGDPCWDIEDTPGFEDHYDDLLEWRVKIEIGWAETRKQREEQFARDLGLAGNLTLARHLMQVQEQISVLQDKVVELEEENARLR
jgi:hypothetical protein